MGAILKNLGDLYVNQDRHDEAEPLYRRSLAIFERKLGPRHPHLAPLLNNMAIVLGKLGKKKKAAAFLERARAMKKRLAGR